MTIAQLNRLDKPAKSGKGRMKMEYVDLEGNDVTHVLNLGHDNAVSLLTRTARWAAIHKITVTLTPVA